MSYQTNVRRLEDLQRRIPRHTACVVSDLREPEAKCQGPHYTLSYSWASAAIFDRQYDHRGPAHHWKFNVISRPGVVVIVTPIYQPRSVGLEEEARRREEDPESTLWSVEECAETHAGWHGTSNWEMTQEFLLRVVAESKPTIHGYIWSSDYCYIYLPDNSSELAQAVLDSLWAAVHGDPRAFAGAKHCAFCGHALTDALSSARGYGPDCCEKYGLPRVPKLPIDENESATAPRQESYRGRQP